MGVSKNWSNFDTSKLGYISKIQRKMDFPLVFYSICTNFAPTEQPAFSISLQTANSEKNQNRKKERLPAHASHTETRGLWPYQHLARDCRPVKIC